MQGITKPLQSRRDRSIPCSDLREVGALASTSPAGGHRLTAVGQHSVQVRGRGNRAQDSVLLPGHVRSSYPGLDHYWREQSYNQMNVTGSGALNLWVTLPQNRAAYIDASGNANLSLLATDCTARGRRLRQLHQLCRDQHDVQRFPGLLRLGRRQVHDVGRRLQDLAHHLGAAVGLRKHLRHRTRDGPWVRAAHSSGAYGQTYDNVWDVMSADRTNCARSRDPTYGCLGQHTISYHKTGKGGSAASEPPSRLFPGHAHPRSARPASDKRLPDGRDSHQRHFHPLLHSGGPAQHLSR